jgi:peptidoglycan/xylan/chitin deacetylase (PgdA/CDA1 family)
MNTSFDKALYLLGVALYRLKLHSIVMWLGRNNPKVLLYHDCSDSETAYTAGLGSTISPEVFDSHLRYISFYYKIIDFSDLEQERAPQRSVAITFDDGYRSVYDNAFPILKKFKCPAKIYLVASVIGNNSMVWVNEINYYLRVHGDSVHKETINMLGLPVGSTPDQIITTLRLNYTTTRIETLLKNIRAKIGIDQIDLSRKARLYLDWGEIAEMQRCGISFGNHTMSHPNLAALTKDEQRIEIACAQDILADRIGEVTSLAYPFGHRSEETASIASRLGLTSMAEVGGANFPLRKHKIGRVHVSATTNAGLFAQMEVVEPVKARLRRWLRLS